MLVDGALSQSIDSPIWVGGASHTGQLQGLLPQAFVLTQTLAHPRCAGISHPFCSDGFHRGLVRGFHLMMKAISRCRVWACEVVSCISFAKQKPESARTSKGLDTRLAAIGKARSRLYSLSDVECCTPGRNANSRQ